MRTSGNSRPIAPGERAAFVDFFGRLVALDSDRRIYKAVWQRFSGPVRLLLENRYVFNPFWQHHNGIDGFGDWEERFKASSRAFVQAFQAGDTAKVLSFVFDRLYVLRNQLVHGGATWNSGINRAQVRDGAAILGFLMPAFIDLMMDNPGKDWGNAKTDTYALLAWCLKALAASREQKLTGIYKRGSVTLEALKDIAKLSVHEDGPRRAKDTLSKWGIHLVCVPHLPRTYLDGAALRAVEDGGAPVVALTLRYDRIDNFWFSLLHELAHVGRHFNGEIEAFVDDFSLRNAPSRREDVRENEADQWAEEALIPRELWATAGLKSHASYSEIFAFSQRVGVHPAIVAGRVRHETRNFRAFASLLGRGEVRKQLDVTA